MGQYSEAFAENDIDAETLRELTGDDLRELGVASLGHRKKLLGAIAGLSHADNEAVDTPATAPTLEGERRQVTVLFADLAGYTKLSSELGAEVLMKATKVDGVFSADPEIDPSAKRFEHLTYTEVLQKQLKVIDMTAVSLCMENRIPIIVFNLKKPGNIARVVAGETIGTTITL